MENKLFCPIRNLWLIITPEEKIRQRLLDQMIKYLNYPISQIVVEKEISQLPHLQGINNIPQRRTDIICYGKDIHPSHSLYPVLLIECKAISIHPKAFNQVIGYNHYVQAPFIGLANEKEIQIGWYDVEKKDYQFIPELPAYNALIQGISS